MFSFFQASCCFVFNESNMQTLWLKSVSCHWTLCAGFVAWTLLNEVSIWKEVISKSESLKSGSTSGDSPWSFLSSLLSRRSPAPCWCRPTWATSAALRASTCRRAAWAPPSTWLWNARPAPPPRLSPVGPAPARSTASSRARRARTGQWPPHWRGGQVCVRIWDVFRRPTLLLGP